MKPELCCAFILLWCLLSGQPTSSHGTLARAIRFLFRAQSCCLSFKMCYLFMYEVAHAIWTHAIRHSLCQMLIRSWTQCISERTEQEALGVCSQLGRWIFFSPGFGVIFQRQYGLSGKASTCSWIHNESHNMTDSRSQKTKR